MRALALLLLAVACIHCGESDEPGSESVPIVRKPSWPKPSVSTAFSIDEWASSEA